MNKILEAQNKVLTSLGGKLQGFYLAGGTALSIFYFKHRQSYDLDFFTQEFSGHKIEGIMAHIQKNTGFTQELIGQQNKEGFAKMFVYELFIDTKSALKVDFVEDFYPLLKPIHNVDAIPVLSIEDIYFRKIIAACGGVEITLPTGRKAFAGGRQEAKDFFDLYFLSSTFKPLSKFVSSYCRQPQIVSIVVWYRSYDRFQIKSGLTEIITDKKVPYEVMERHFKTEIEQLLTAEM